MSTPSLKPIELKEHTCSQGHYGEIVPKLPMRSTVGLHNFSLRIFNLRVSNPNELIVDVFLTRCWISMCQGLGQKKHDEISETDRKQQYIINITIRARFEQDMLNKATHAHT